MQLAMFYELTIYPTLSWYCSGKNNLPWLSYNTNLVVPCLMLIALYILHVLYAAEVPFMPQYE